MHSTQPRWSQPGPRRGSYSSSLCVLCVLCRGAFQLGDAPLSMLRIQLKPASSMEKGTRQAVLLGDVAGGMGECLDGSAKAG